MNDNDGITESTTIKNFALIQSKRSTLLPVSKTNVCPALICLLYNSVTIIDNAKQKLLANFSIENMVRCSKHPICEVVFTIERNTQQIAIGDDNQMIILEPIKSSSGYNNKIELESIVGKINEHCDAILSNLELTLLSSTEVPTSSPTQDSKPTCTETSSTKDATCPVRTTSGFLLKPKQVPKFLQFNLLRTGKQSSLHPMDIIPTERIVEQSNVISTVEYDVGDHFFVQPPIHDGPVRMKAQTTPIIGHLANHTQHPESNGAEVSSSMVGTGPLSSSPVVQLSPKQIAKLLPSKLCPKESDDVQGPSDPKSDVKSIIGRIEDIEPAPVKVQSKPAVEKLDVHEKLACVEKPKTNPRLNLLTTGAFSKSVKEAAQLISRQRNSNIRFSRDGMEVCDNKDLVCSDDTYADAGDPWWFKRDISREAANDLMRDKPLGAFIVRKANTFAFALVCGTGGKSVNFSISYDPEMTSYRLASMEDGTENKIFSSLSEFVEFYKEQAINYPGGLMKLDDTCVF